MELWWRVAFVTVAFLGLIAWVASWARSNEEGR